MEKFQKIEKIQITPRKTYNITLTTEEKNQLVAEELENQKAIKQNEWESFSEKHLTNHTIQNYKILEERLIFTLEESLHDTKLLLCAGHISETRNCSLLNEFRFIEDDLMKMGIRKCYYGASFDMKKDQTLQSKCQQLGRQILDAVNRERLFELQEKVGISFRV